MKIKPVDNVYFGAHLSHKQKDRNMEAKEAFELVLLMAKTTTTAKSEKRQEALEVAEDYMVYWRGK